MPVGTYVHALGAKAAGTFLAFVFASYIESEMFRYVFAVDTGAGFDSAV
jgi:hypothetical protein